MESLSDLFSSIPGSTVGIVGAVILAVLGIVGKWMSGKKSSNEDLEREISEVEAALAKALEEGMITDAQRLAKRLWKLRERLGRRLHATTTATAVTVALCLMASGCWSTGGKKVEYVVIGERIVVLEPGQMITVPPLVPPASKWYMVDDEGLKGWLGITGRDDK